MRTGPDVNKRITSIDYLRGVVMIIMALDHVRDFFHVTAQTDNPLNLTTTTPALFFTRWITHLCAPTFLFLSGVSAYLSGRNKSKKDLGNFLIKRGIWIAIVDFIVMSFALSFNPHYNFIMLTTLWAIGCSMILLGLAIKLSDKIILPFGLVLFFVHDYIASLAPASKGFGQGLFRVLFNGGYIVNLDPGHLIGFLYAILPWTCVMFIGYGMGSWIRDKKKLLFTGAGLLALFIILRFINVYGDPRPWKQQPSPFYTFLSFINTTKYYPSLQFLCMTLGIALLFLGLAGNRKQLFKQFASVYGRVPFFYFVLHFFLAHLLLIAAFYLTGHTNAQIVDPKSPFWFRPQAFGFSLAIVYAIWISVVLFMYYPCLWFYRHKSKSHKWWLRYL